MLAVLAGSLGFLALAQSEPPVTSGLLLGLRAEVGGVSRYRTLWIAPQRGQVRYLEAKNLLVARKSGWWRVGQGRYRAGTGDWTFDLDAPWAVPANEKSWVDGLKLAQDEQKCNSVGRASILFVGSDDITLETDQGGYCEGAAHPTQWNGLATYALDAFRAAPTSWNDLGSPALADRPLKFRAIFQPSDALEAAGRAFYDKQDAEWKDRLSDHPEDDSWGLVRRAGNWVVRGRLNYSSEAARGSFKDFDVPVSAPARLVGPSGQGFTLDEIQAGLPDAKDFVLSPARDLLAIVRPSSLRVEHVWGGKPARKLALSIPLQRGESIVMAQWAIGRGLERWQKDVPALLKR